MHFRLLQQQQARSPLTEQFDEPVPCGPRADVDHPEGAGYPPQTASEREREGGNMTTRAAIQTVAGGPLIIDELALPEPGADQVAVKLFSSGICHSQLHGMANATRPRPMLLGHEATGVVVQAGAEVTHVREGDHVIVTWVTRTPQPVPQAMGPPVAVEYRGQSAFYNHVHTWSEHVVAVSERVVRIAPDAPTDVSCIVGCAVLTGAGAVTYTAGVRPGDSVAVFGVGGVGLSALRMAALLEAHPVIAVDLRDDKLQFARRFGATHTVNAGQVDPIEAITDLTGGGVDYAFDAIGVRATTEQILDATRPGWIGAHSHGGMAVLIGIPPAEMTLDPRKFMMHQRRYTGSHGASIPERDFPMYLRLHAEGKFPLDELVTDRYRLDQINEACAALRAGDIMGRAIIEYD